MSCPWVSSGLTSPTCKIRRRSPRFLPAELTLLRVWFYLLWTQTSDRPGLGQRQPETPCIATLDGSMR